MQDARKSNSFFRWTDSSPEPVELLITLLSVSVIYSCLSLCHYHMAVVTVTLEDTAAW